MANLTYDFSGRTAIVTGAARGLGLAIARQFAAAGAEVVMVDADGEALAEAASYAGGTPAVADVADTGQVEGVVADAMTRTGRVDIVVNNAGILRDAMLWKLDDAQWDAVLAVHAGGTFRLTRAAVPQMRAAGRGRIINVTSYTGLRGNPGQVNYATAKAGIIGFTKTAAKELARFGITVNAISPNAETRMIESIPGDTRAQLTAGIPLGRFADPAEIGPAVAFPRLGRGGLHHRHSPAGRRRPVHLAFVAPS